MISLLKSVKKKKKVKEIKWHTTFGDIIVTEQTFLQDGVLVRPFVNSAGVTNNVYLSGHNYDSNTMVNRKINKIFGIGFQKTGTKTLHAALEILGYTVCGCRHVLIDPLKQNDWGPVLKMVNENDAFEDNPWPLLYERLDQEFPNSRFILTIRESDKWIHSAVNHFGTIPGRMQEWIYNQGYPGGYEEIYLERYERHNREVIEYFKDRPNDLLIINWADGNSWRPLCHFLNHKIPKEGFPHANKGHYNIIRSVFWKLTIFLVRQKRKIIG